VPPGVEGIVLDARVFSRRGVDKDDRAKSIEDDEVGRLLKDQSDEIEIIAKSVRSRLESLLVGKKVFKSIFDRNGHELVSEGEVITKELVEKFSPIVWGEVQLEGHEDDILLDRLRRIVNQYSDQVELVRVVFDEKVNKLRKGDELPPGVIKMIKVYVAIKRKLSVGDKMAGRHGNKGVVSRILPEEDMPFFEDGTPVDIVLNPLGVPSRMNVGQILETHLGWGCAALGKQIREMVETIQKINPLRQRLQRTYGKRDYQRYFKDMTDDELIEFCKQTGRGIHVATPVFDSAEEDELDEFLKAAGLPVRGQALLCDGRTGELFDQPVTVGIMYMMKLHHLVDDKIHARSIGPYSLVTQQPLGGKAQFGGQRLGEMEVWALEAYGAAYSLQEFLTVKSDDVAGRTRMYEKIVKGDNVLEPGLPESFNVLVKELKSLGMDVELFEDKEE
jgi:DNA-directed RNA polymerase subunit beta